MNKKLFISMLTLSIVITGVTMNSAKAEDNSGIQHPRAYEKLNIKPPYEAPETKKEIPALKYFGPGPQIDKNHPMEMRFPKYRSQEAMKAKKAEFEKRLNLTDKQKKKIEENRKKDHEKMKPVFENMKLKHEELKKIKADTTLSEEEKLKKTNEIKKELKELKIKADGYRKENMKNFESVLTNEQKKEFAKIKEEQRKHMMERRKEFQHHKRFENAPKKEIGRPVQPNAEPIEK